MDLDGADAALARLFRRNGDVMPARREPAQHFIGLQHALKPGHSLGVAILGGVGVNLLDHVAKAITDDGEILVALKAEHLVRFDYRFVRLTHTVQNKRLLLSNR